MSKIKEIFKSYIDKATLHGVGRLYDSKYKIGRLFWLLAFLCFWAILVYQVYGLVHKLKSYEIQTVITTEQQTNEMDFPSVTICNSNPWPFIKTIDYLSQHLPHLRLQPDDLEGIFDAFLHIPGINSLSLQAFGFDLENLIPLSLCKFNHKKCKKEYFSVTSTYPDGNCFSFNPQGTFKQPQAGFKSGFLFIFNIRQDEGISVESMKDLVSVGALVSIHIPHHKLYDGVKSLSILAPPNQLTKIAIKKERIFRLEHPYADNCTQNNVRIDKHQYSIPLCRKRCHMMHIYKRCRVLEFGDMAMSDEIIGINTTLANTTQEIECISKIHKEIAKGKVQCSCPPLCHDLEYTKTISYGLWPSQLDMFRLKQHFYITTGQNYTSDFIQQNFGAVKVYYEDFTVRTIKHKAAYDSNAFFSDLGGQIGLWLGASIFSFMEILVLLFEFITSCCSAEKKNNEVIHQ